MSTTRNKNLLFVIGVLLLTNIAVLVYFLAIKKTDSHAHDMNDRKGGFMIDMLQKEVGFDTTQMAAYKKLKDEQRNNFRPLFDRMRGAKDSLYRLLGNSTATDSMINVAAERIGQDQKMLDLETFRHFKRVRELCSSPAQQAKYDSAVLRMFSKMGRPRKADADKKGQ